MTGRKWLDNRNAKRKSGEGLAWGDGETRRGAGGQGRPSRSQIPKSHPERKLLGREPLLELSSHRVKVGKNSKRGMDQSLQRDRIHKEV